MLQSSGGNLGPQFPRVFLELSRLGAYNTSSTWHGGGRMEHRMTRMAAFVVLAAIVLAVGIGAFGGAG